MNALLLLAAALPADTPPDPAVEPAPSPAFLAAGDVLTTSYPSGAGVCDLHVYTPEEAEAIRDREATTRAERASARAAAFDRLRALYAAQGIETDGEPTDDHYRSYTEALMKNLGRQGREEYRAKYDEARRLWNVAGQNSPRQDPRTDFHTVLALGADLLTYRDGDEVVHLPVARVGNVRESVARYGARTGATLPDEPAGD